MFKLTLIHPKSYTESDDTSLKYLPDTEHHDRHQGSPGQLQDGAVRRPLSQPEPDQELLAELRGLPPVPKAQGGGLRALRVLQESLQVVMSNCLGMFPFSPNSESFRLYHRRTCSCTCTSTIQSEASGLVFTLNIVASLFMQDEP